MTRRGWGILLALSIVAFATVLLAGRGAPPDPEYAFLETQPGSPRSPVRWEPCVPIVYQVHASRAPGTPEETLAFLDEAFDHVAGITGLEFRHEPGLGRPFDVSISWASADEVGALAGRVAGVTRGGVTTRAERRWFATGQVVLDVEVFDRTGLDDRGRAIVLHELGHLVGLDHVDSRAELMYPTTTRRLDYGRGDREGLARLGKGPTECD